MLRNIKADRLLMVLIVMMIIEMLLLLFYGISRHYNYLTSIVDLGHADQSIWGTLNGKLFLNTDNYNKEVIGRIEPILLLFVPLYNISPSVLWLILVKSVAIPITCVPIYFLARRVSQSDQAAFFWASACLFSPFMLSAASWDFQAVTLAVPIVAMSFLAVEKRQPLVLLIACLFILFSKEHFGLLVAGFGLLWLIKYREWKVAFPFIAVGLGYFYAVMNIIIPLASPTGQHGMISEGMGHVSRYGWIGGSVLEIAEKIITSPTAIFYEALVNMRGWLYLLVLFFTVIFLPIVGCEFLIPGVSDLLANLLSKNPMPRSIYSYHSVTLVPIVIASAIYGSCRVYRRIKVIKKELQACAVFVITLIMSYMFFPFSPLPGTSGFWNPKRIIAFGDSNYQAVHALIKREMSVSVQANVGAHFTQRNEVYMYPNRVGDVDAVILHLDSPTTFLGQGNPGVIASLAHHLQMSPIDYLDSIRDLVDSNKYSRIFWQDPWLIFLKSESELYDHSGVMEKIEQLEQEWCK